MEETQEPIIDFTLHNGVDVDADDVDVVDVDGMKRYTIVVVVVVVAEVIALVIIVVDPIVAGRSPRRWMVVGDGFCGSLTSSSAHCT